MQEDYRKKDQEVKRSLKRDKREWANGIAQEAENAAKLGQMKGVYDATRKQTVSLYHIVRQRS